MGHLNYYSHDFESTHASFADSELQDPGTLQHIVQPVRSLFFFRSFGLSDTDVYIDKVAMAGNAAIAVGSRYCWCFDWLGKNLETEFSGTHGIMFPWDLPKSWRRRVRVGAGEIGAGAVTGVVSSSC